MSSGRALLLHARTMIECGWTQLADARGADGEAIEPWSSRAAAWSLLGALVAALEAEAMENEPLALDQLGAACAALAAVIDHDSLESWNDDPTRTRDQVLNVLDRAATQRGRAA
jgi:hypothetical protein